MVDSDFVQSIVDLAESEVVEVHGVSYLKTSGGVSLIHLPTINTLSVFSLTQIVSFVKSWIGDGRDGLIVNVDSPDRVTIRSHVHDDGSRTLLAEASMKEIHETFPFGQKLTQEEFIIKLMTQFESDYERTSLGEVVSSVRAEKVQEAEDDGISQVVSSKAGVHLTTTKTVQKFWNLKTYKTFPEVEQPIIPYMLRLHQRAEELPMFALYVCDGGKWKINTTIAVRDWLTNQLKTELGEKFGTDVVVL